MSRPELRQFAQRVSVDFHLRPLDRGETHAYVNHRLKVAGAKSTLFMPEAIEFVYARTKGVPRLMNQLCDFALLYAFADGRLTIDADLIAQVVRDRSTSVALPTPPLSEMPAAAGLPTNGAA